MQNIISKNGLNKERILSDAIAFATEAHKGQARKGTKTPYIIHPMEAATIAATMTDDPLIIAAAILHDVLEDTDHTAKEIEEKFGKEVLSLILGDSENKRSDRLAAETWQIRKQETISYVKNHASVQEKIVILSDKLSNLRAIYRDSKAIGPTFWNRFNQNDPAKHKWYYSSVIDACSELADTEAYQEARELIECKIKWSRGDITVEAPAKKQFSEIQLLIDTMRESGFDYRKDYQIMIDHVNQRAQGILFTLSDHISAMIFSQLSNQRPWEGIAQNADHIKRIFCNFDPDWILAMSNEQLQQIVNDLKAIRCGNRQIAKQIFSLQANIKTLQTIAADHGSIDAYYNETPTDQVIQSLSAGKYKLKQMGVPLVSEYLRNVGMDIIKPDTHVKRILGRLGYTASNPATDAEAIDVCAKIAAEYGIRNIEIDAILWQYCADNFFEKCTATPNCQGCKAYPCANCPEVL